MKKIINKIFLVFAILSLVVPTTFVSATEPTAEPTPTPETTNDPAGENSSEGNKTEEETPKEEVNPTPSVTPVAPKIEAKLDNLEVVSYKFKEAFSKDKTEYKLTVKSDVEKITINASAPEGVTVAGDIGDQELAEGLNTYEIKSYVSNDDGTTNFTTYTIKITRSTSDLSLKILSITGHPLNETFDPTVLDYTADVSYDTQSVIVKAGATNADATPQISGNSNLKVGKNTVRIVVKNSSGETQEYRIVVNRATEEEVTDDDTSSQVSSEVVTSPNVEPDTKDEDNDNNNNNGDALNYVLVVIFCILLLVIAGLGIYFYVRTGNSEKRKQKRIEKLKKKQAKIDQELTSLLPVITDEMIEEHSNKVSEQAEEFYDDDFEDTIELDKIVEEEVEIPNPKKRIEKNVLEDFDDLFLDE